MSPFTAGLMCLLPNGKSAPLGFGAGVVAPGGQCELRSTARGAVERVIGIYVGGFVLVTSIRIAGEEVFSSAGVPHEEVPPFAGPWPEGTEYAITVRSAVSPKG